jgi:polar amino acid transport system substrate-binding protein
MKKYLQVPVVMVTLPASAAATGPQQMADPRVADLVQTGRICVALFPPQYTKNPATGEIGGMQIDLARTLAARLGIEVLPVEYATPAEVVEALKAGACDVAFLVVDPVRAAAVDFSPPYVERDFTYLVPADSAIRSAADADQAGVRIAVVRAHASTLALGRIVQHAALVQTDSLDAALDLLRGGQVHLVASARHDLVKYATQLPGSRVLTDRYGSSQGAIAVAKGHPGWLAYISEFIKEAKVSGVVQQALERAGQGDAQVAPRGHPKAQQ